MGGSINSEQLMLYFNLALTVIVVLGALGGFIKGFKKSLFRFIKDIIFVAGFFFTADLVAGFILNSNEVFDLLAQYVPVSGMPTNMIELVQCFMVDYLGVNPDATLTSSIHFIFAIASIAFKLVYAIIYFIIIRILYNIVCAIIYKVLFNRKQTETFFKLKKRKSGKVKKIKEKVDLRKGTQGPRLLGALFGAGKSMITVTMLVSLIMSIVSLLPKGLGNYISGDSNVTASNQTTLSEENKDILRDTLKGLEEYIIFIEDLENSPYVKFVRTIESDGKTLDLVLFDTVMNGQYEEYNIRTRESLSLIVDIGFDVFTIINESVDSDGYLDLNNVDIDHIAELVEKVTEIDLLMESIPVMVELGLSMEAVEASLPIPLDDNLKESIGEIDWKNDVMVLADIIRTLGDVEDLNTVFNEPGNLLSKDNEKVITNVIKKFSELTLVTKMLPSAVEYAMSLEEVQELIGYATIDLSNIVWEEELVQVAEIYSVFQTLTQDVTKLLFAEEINAGDLVDGVNLNALNNLILEIFELGLMEELFEPIMDLVVSSIEDEAIKEMLNFDIDNYEDWAKEFTIIIDIVKELLAGGNPFENGLDVGIIANVNPDTIVKSKILSQVMISALVDASNGEGIFAGEGAQELAEFIDIPSYLKDKNSPLWYNVYDEDGNVISKGQLHKTLAALQTILPDENETRINVNETLQLALIFGGAEYADVVFTSSNPAVATVDQLGLVEGKSAGHAVIMVTTSNGKVKDMIDIIVKSEVAVPVEYVHIEGEVNFAIEIGLGKGNREFLSASTNLDASNQIITWESLNEDIVKVSEDGAIEGLQVGQAIIKATSNADPSKFAICTVTVVETVKETIEVNKENIVGHVGKVFYVDASINGEKEELNYFVNNETVASVDENGFVELVGLGETTLTISNKNNTLSKVINILVLDDSLPTSIKLTTSVDAGFAVSSVLSSITEQDVETILESDVLTRSLSKILLSALGDAAADGTDQIHIPQSVMENDAGVEYISKEELKNILNIVVEVDIASLFNGEDVTELLTSLTDEDVDAILQSKVLNAFLTSTLSNIGDGMIVVPSTAYQDAALDYCYEHSTQEIKYIKNSEVKAVIKMLNKYDLLSGSDISIPLSADNSELINLLEESSILRATLSKIIIDMAQGDGAMIVVPDQALELLGDSKVLKINEFESVLDALYDLGIHEISQDISLELNVGALTSAKDSINESLVLRATISNFIVPLEEVVVPDQALDSTSYTANGAKVKLLKKNELSSLVDALVTILGEDASFDSISLDLNVGKIKTALPQIENSTILKATVSSLVCDLEEVVVPDQATDNENYSVDGSKISVLKDHELEGLVNTLVSLLGEDTTIDNIQLDLSMGDLKDSLSDIKPSTILMATISKYIVDVEEVVTPDQAFAVGYTVDSISIDVLKEAELEGLVNTLVSLLGVDATIDSISLDLSVGDLNDSLEDIKSSTILMATISKYIVDVEAIVVPDQSLDDGYTVDSVSIDVLKDTELDGLVNTLVSLLGVDATVENISLDLTIGELKDSLTSIKQSTIIMATLSKVIVDLDEIIVPDQAVEADYYTVNNEYIPMLLDDELDGLVNTLASFMDENDKVDHIELELSLGSLQDSLASIKQSKILMATISDKIVPLENIIVPDQATNNVDYSLNGTKIRVLRNTELDSLVNTLVDLLGENASVDNIELNLTIKELKDSLVNIKQSKILMATISDVIKDLNEIVVPDQAYTSEDYSVNNEPISVLQGSELDGLINTLASFMDENQKVDHIELELSLGSLQDSLDEINTSTILMATISDIIVPLENIVVPDQALASGYTLNASEIDVLKSTELNSLVNTLVDLLGENASVDNIELNLTIKELKDSLVNIEQSKILMATISDAIIELDAIVVPDQALNKNDYTVEGTPVSMLYNSELEGLIDTLATLVDENQKVNNIELDISTGSLQDSLASIKQSKILMATISDIIVPLEAIIVPDQVLASGYTLNAEKLSVLTTTELEVLTDALVTLLGHNASLMNIELDLTVSQLNDAVSSINASGILRTTIGDMIIPLSSIIIPDEAVINNLYSKGLVYYPVLKEDELTALFASLNALTGSSKVDSLNLDLTVGKLNESVNIFKQSSILRATITDKLDDVSALIKPDQSFEAPETFHDNGVSIKVIKGTELVAFTTALASLLGADTELNNELSLNISVEKLQAAVNPINASAILKSTIGDKIVNNGNLLVPDQAIDSTSYSIGSTKVKVLEDAELQHLVDALEALLGKNATIDGIELDLTVGKLKDSISDINNSMIIRSTISDKINDVSALTIVNEAYEENGTLTKDSTNLNVLKAAELKGLIDSLVALLGENTEILGSLELTLTVSELYDSVDEINTSLVLRATITNKIKVSLDIPDDALDVIIYHEGSSETRILSTSELKALAKALVNILGNGQSLESFGIPTNLVSILLTPSDEINKNKLEQSLESLIIWDKISNMIDDVTGSLIKVPDAARVDGNSENRITVKEINGLFEALNVLGVSDINNISLNANFIMLLDDETKDALGNTELTRTTIALEKSKILMASIPSLFESGIRGAYEEAITLDFGTTPLEGVLNSEGTAYVTEGELVRLFRAVRAANTLKNKTLADITGKISDSSSSVAFINKQFLAINASEILKPTVAQVLATLVDRDELLGASFSDNEISLILAQTASVQDLNSYATANKTGNYITDSQITAIQLTATANMLSAITYLEVEAIYDAAVSAIDAL